MPRVKRASIAWRIKDGSAGKADTQHFCRKLSKNKPSRTPLPGIISQEKSKPSRAAAGSIARHPCASAFACNAAYEPFVVRQESANKATSEASAIGLSGSMGVEGVAATEGDGGNKSGERPGEAGVEKSGKFGTGISATLGAEEEGAGEFCRGFTGAGLGTGIDAPGEFVAIGEGPFGGDAITGLTGAELLGGGNGAGGDPAGTVGVKVDEDKTGGAEGCGGAEEGAAATGGKGAGAVGLTEIEGGVVGVPAGAGAGATVAVMGGTAAAVAGAVTDGVDEGVAVGEAAVGGASGSDARRPGKSLAKVLRETSPLSFPGDPTTLTMAGRLR